jgi:hypothetical protein
MQHNHRLTFSHNGIQYALMVQHPKAHDDKESSVAYQSRDEQNSQAIPLIQQRSDQCQLASDHVKQA